MSSNSNIIVSVETTTEVVSVATTTEEVSVATTTEVVSVATTIEVVSVATTIEVVLVRAAVEVVPLVRATTSNDALYPETCTRDVSWINQNTEMIYRTLIKHYLQQ